MTIATIDNKENRTILICFFIFMDSISYTKIFKYLNENYNFNPKKIHCDYERAIELAIKNSKFFKYEIMIVKCFFHFVKAIRDRLKSYQTNKKYLNKDNYVILKNLELICFINEENIGKYKVFI